MKLCDNLCRFCLKITNEEDQVALFEEENSFDRKESNGTNWRRIFSFIFYADGLPNQICKFCQSQVVWIAEFYKTVFENDCSLRSALAKEGANTKTVTDHSDNQGPSLTRIKCEVTDESQPINEQPMCNFDGQYDGMMIEESQTETEVIENPIVKDFQGYVNIHTIKSEDVEENELVNEAGYDFDMQEDGMLIEDNEVDEVKEKKNSKRLYKPYMEETLQEALNQIRSKKMTLYAASRDYGIPGSTLKGRLSGKSKSKIGRPTAFSPEIEQEIETWILEMTEVGLPVRNKSLLQSITLLARSLGAHNRIPNGEKWARKFLERHPKLAIKKVPNLSKYRTLPTKEDVQEWFSKIGSYFNTHGLQEVISDPSRVWNCDELSFEVFSTPRSGPKIKRVYNKKANDDKEYCSSVMLTVSASGKFAPTLVCYPYEKRIPVDIVQSFPSEWVLGRSANGYQKAQTFKDYITQSFYPYILQQQIKLPIILFLDGQKSHLTIELGTFCKEHEIVLIVLPPNSMQFTQPLDVFGFQSLKEKFESEVTNWRSDNNGISQAIKRQPELPKKEFAPLLKASLDKINIDDDIINGFRSCGIYPFDVKALDSNNESVVRSISENLSMANNEPVPGLSY